jgi:hypothetical protein
MVVRYQGGEGEERVRTLSSHTQNLWVTNSIPPVSKRGSRRLLLGQTLRYRQRLRNAKGKATPTLTAPSPPLPTGASNHLASSHLLK